MIYVLGMDPDPRACSAVIIDAAEKPVACWPTLTADELRQVLEDRMPRGLRLAVVELPVNLPGLRDKAIAMERVFEARGSATLLADRCRLAGLEYITPTADKIRRTTTSWHSGMKRHSTRAGKVIKWPYDQYLVYHLEKIIGLDLKACGLKDDHLRDAYQAAVFGLRTERRKLRGEGAVAR